jgi:GSH-dependent disulfide-bond oxidoreductase
VIDLYTWPAPNGHKIQIAVEELEVAYALRPVNITKGEQFAPAYVALNPNAKIPTIVDHDPPAGYARPHVVFETAAILIYLAEKTGRLLPADPTRRSEALQWLMWLTAGLGPMFGQMQHFHRYAAERHAYALERYERECYRLLDVLERRLAAHEYLADEYSIADIATFPWIRLRKYGGLDPDRHPAVNRWYAAVRARPAVGRGLDLLRDDWVDIARSAEAKANLFGRTS